MNTKNWVTRLQQLPLPVRVRILWVTAVLAAIGLVALWAISLKSQVSRLDTGNMLPTLPATEKREATHVKAEWVKREEGKLNIYFKVTNSSADILDFPDIADIKLKTGDQETAAENITDRQSKPFVKRVLSQTENYGILTFPNPSTDKATLIFDQLYFETQQDQIFSEQLELNFKDLNQAPQLLK